MSSIISQESHNTIRWPAACRRMQGYIPAEATDADSLVLQVWHAIDIVPVAPCDNCPAQWVIHPMADNLVSSFGGILRLRLSCQTGNPALSQPNGDIDLIAAQRRDHVACARREWGQGDLVWEGRDGRRA